ncbi:MAG: hypothetical protein JKY13_02950, partial [Gammaproteobacteria bacterium]|nr:hypothetical protein [Gammaproteobacteria bacterium]
GCLLVPDEKHDKYHRLKRQTYQLSLLFLHLYVNKRENNNKPLFAIKQLNLSGLLRDARHLSSLARKMLYAVIGYLTRTLQLLDCSGDTDSGEVLRLLSLLRAPKLTTLKLGFPSYSGQSLLRLYTLLKTHTTITTIDLQQASAQFTVGQRSRLKAILGTVNRERKEGQATPCVIRLYIQHQDSSSRIELKSSSDQIWMDEFRRKILTMLWQLKVGTLRDYMCPNGEKIRLRLPSTMWTALRIIDDKQMTLDKKVEKLKALLAKALKTPSSERPETTTVMYGRMLAHLNRHYPSEDKEKHSKS